MQVFSGRRAIWNTDVFRSFTNPMPNIDTIIADFDLLDDWEDRYRYVIELGRNLKAFPEAERTDANKVQGCTSQVWLTVSRNMSDRGQILHLLADSDAHIVRGLLTVILALFDGKTTDEILTTDADATFKTLGLAEHLTPQRSNGVKSIVERIRAEARRAL